MHNVGQVENAFKVYQVLKFVDRACAQSVRMETMHLSDFMALCVLSDEQVGKAIGRSRASVSRYRRRLVRPDWEAIEQIRRYSKGAVTADDWLEPLIAVGSSAVSRRAAI
jgi:hypothetical protein